MSAHGTSMFSAHTRLSNDLPSDCDLPSNYMELGNAVLGCNLKNERMISVHFQGKPFNITVIQVYALTSNAEEAEVEQFHEDLRPSRMNTPKRCSFHYRGVECKNRKLRNTWSSRQIWPWSTE